MVAMSGVSGVDYTVDPGPPLKLPPLSLLQLASPLLDTDDLVGQQQQAAEMVLSAQSDLSALEQPMDAEDDLATLARQTATEAAQNRIQEGEAWLSAVNKRLAEIQRWEHGFQYLPELSQATGMSIFVPDGAPAITNPIGGAQKPVGPDQTPFAWYDPFQVVALDSRSAFGWPNTDFASRSRRALRALQNHESWDVEREFWTGANIPTNYHLSASPSTLTTSPHRTVTGWPNPTAPNGTVLGTAVGLGQSLAALDQAIADADAGTGVIHASPYLVQRWASVYSYLRDSDGKVYTVNHNLILSGYGYPGTGPDVASRTVTDGVTATSTTLTSASAAFTTADIGSGVTGTNIAAGSYIVSVTSATVAVLNLATTGGGSGLTINIGPRTVADGVLNSTTTVTSATAAFTASDVGAQITGSGIPAGTTILSVDSGSSITLSQPVLGDAVTVTLVIGQSRYQVTGNRYQWAYATDWLYTCAGAANIYPWDFRQGSPDFPVDNLAEIRAERSWSVISNQLLRAAVLVDTTTA